MEGFVGEGCIRAKGGVGDGLGKCLVHDDVGLEVFSVAKFSHIRDQKVNKGLVGINLV